jgi:hypothetical protein
MIALLFAQLAVAAPYVEAEDTFSDVHLRLDTDVTWGIGGQMYLGAQTHLLAQMPAWHGARSSGTFDVSLRAAYGNEGAYFAPWLDPEVVFSEGHRLQLQLGVGHAFHIGQQRRFTLGVQALAGWNHLTRVARITYTEEDFAAEGRSGDNDLVVSGELTMAYRLHDRVGLNLSLNAPVPLESTYIITMAQVGFGVSWYLR